MSRHSWDVFKSLAEVMPLAYDTSNIRFMSVLAFLADLLLPNPNRSRVLFKYFERFGYN